MNVPFADFSVMHTEIRDQLDAAIRRVVDANYFIGSPENKDFEDRFAAYCGANACVGCGNGLDALQLILRAYGIGAGDEVIVPAHTFIATGLAVTYVGAKPVFVDVEPHWYCLDAAQIEDAITERTKAIMMVHIYGQVGEFQAVREIADKHGLLLIEDAAQAHGARYRGQRTGSLADAAGFSFYPGKNLGAFGDGGAAVCRDAAVAERIRTYGNYGARTKYQHVYKGVNSRLDSVQAAVLSVKLESLDRWNAERRRIAGRYKKGITNPSIRLPQENPDAEHVWHIFPVMAEGRDALIAHLRDQGITALCHYPVPMHLHQAYADLGYAPGRFPVAEYIASHEVSLPMYYGMTEEQIDHVIDAVNRF